MNVPRRNLFKLVGAATFSLATSATVAKGAEVESSEVVGSDELAEKSLREIQNVLSGLREQADSLGLSNISFDELALGQPIATYIAENGSLSQSDFMYPVLSDDSIAFWLMDTEDGIQATDALAEEVNSAIAPNEPFCIIYDAEAAYAFVGDGLVRLFTYKKFSDRDLVDVSVARELQTSSYGVEKQSLIIPMANAYNAYVSVPKIKQPQGSSLCWAACIASIVNCRKGTSLTCAKVAQYWFGVVDYDHPLNNDIAYKVINSWGLSYKYKSSVPSASVINKNLSKGFPIFACWSYGSGVGHATVVRGIGSSNVLSLMDPANGTFTTASVSSKTWKARSGGTGKTMTMICVTANYIS